MREIASAPDLLALHRLDPARYPVLFESSAHGTPQGRWDLLPLADGARIEWRRDRVEAGEADSQDFFAALDAAWQAERSPRVDAAARPPFVGGWAVFLAYEAAAQVERVLRLPRAEGPLPIAVAQRCPAAVLRERGTGRTVAVAEADDGAWIETIERDLAHAASLPPLPPWQAPRDVAEDRAARFTRSVERVLDYLAAGDVFQVNLSRTWTALFDAPADAAGLFAQLRRANPAPFAGLFTGPGWAVVSASPERLVSVSGDLVQTRPIAGTRPRLPGDDDADRVRELVGHPKERAEHVMLIDLERNDLGRVCRPGTVEVDELMTVESYAHVHHIVSNVRGRLRDDVTPGEVLRAVFPGGTITGCPKVRCMQIIAELEATGRGAYTGAMGWLGRDGDMDFNILIRSAEVAGTEVRFRAGAGIVADSDPVRELEETRAKARGMLRALGV
ncbi:aminodeoxychorismate synthase component I [Lysobacter humi (ex Lee et al. 2017)]